MKKLLEMIFGKKCNHEWELNGWSTIKCKHCGYVNEKPSEVSQFLRNFFESRIIDGHPDLDRNAWNRGLVKRKHGRDLDIHL